MSRKCSSRLRTQVLEVAEQLLDLVRRLVDRDLAPVLVRDLLELGVVDASAPLWSRTLPLSSTSLPSVVLPTRSSLDAAEERVAEDLDFLVARRARASARSVSSIAWARSSLSVPLREKMRALITMPPTPGGTLSELSRTSPAFSPKIARSSFSSGESWVSPLGVILPTRMSPGFTSAPMRTMPLTPIAPRLVDLEAGDVDAALPRA